MVNAREVDVPDNMILVSKTDIRGKIVYANQAFMKIVGYTEDELVNRPHSIVRHSEMPRIIFKMLWNYLKRGSEIHAYVQNRTKDGSSYWVLANVFPIFDLERRVIGYHSSRRKAKAEVLEKIKPLYRTLLEIEQQRGVEKSEEYFEKLLSDHEMEYDEFVLSI